VRESPVVKVEGLRVSFPRSGRRVDVVTGVDLEIAPGEMVGLVGESGSGKTLVSLAIAGLVPYPGRTTSNRLDFMGVDMIDRQKRATGTLLGKRLGVVFQDPMSSLNPLVRVGRQVGEKAEVHLRTSRREAFRLAVAGMRAVGIGSPETRSHQYPHEFSGGMRQRAMIAMGLTTDPALIIADEPTTALDVTVQAQILDLLRRANVQHKTAVLLVSHDVAVINELCSRVLVMYAGRVVESLPVKEMVASAAHPYTKALLASIVDLNAGKPLATIPGRPPNPESRPSGCAFEPRCPLAVERCRVDEPTLEALAPDRAVACWVAVGKARG
jgi:oligopeptide/dipeptide ABC transporter ATP-binding protein